MVSTTIALLTLFAQKPQLKSIRVFDGGSFEQYMRFVASSGSVKGTVCVYPERLFSAAGPSRALRFSDGSTQLEPALMSLLKLSGKDNCRLFEPRILPRPYCRPIGRLSSRGALEDNVSYLQEKMTADKAPGIEGSFRLGNGLAQLGYAIKVHQFFDDMWVQIRFTGTWTPELLDAIAKCVGANIAKEAGTPTIYRIEPNVEEIRQRALATLEFFTPTADTESTNAREQLRYEFIRDASPDLLKRWIDAAGKRDRMSVTDQKWIKAFGKYRDLFFGELMKAGRAPKEFKLEDYKSMNIFFDMIGYLEFGVTLQAPNGLLIHI